MVDTECDLALGDRTRRRKTGNGKKPYKRVITPARKEQNRVAQKAYRQRQKERQEQQLQRQRARKATNRLPDIAPYPAPLAVDLENTSTTAQQSSDRNTLLDSFLEPNCTVSTSSQDESTQVAYRPHSAADSNQFLANDLLPMAPSIPLDAIDIIYMGKLDTQMLSLGISTESAVDVMGNTRDLAMQTTPDSQQENQQGPTILEEGENLELNRVGNFSKSAASLSSIIEDKSPRRNTLAPRVVDPYMNSLELAQVSLLRICLYNARSLGIDVDPLFGWDCMLLCSPLYRPMTTVQDDPKALLAAVSSPSIPIHLRPTLPQILFPHHPVLDLIPFPELRARAITLAATSPQFLNPLELKMDIVRGGLVCWGTNKNSGGQPWDMRSWEAKPWFLRKWRLLIGGEDSELWKQSNWWQSMRGELPVS